MDQYLNEIVFGGSLLLLSGMVAAGLFFVMVGLRELKEGCLEGLLYVVLAIFFAVAHFYLLYGASSGGNINLAVSHVSLWSWMILLVAPALIALYLGFGFFSFLTARFREGMIKTFFGLTLVCYLYMLGPHWPVDIRGIMILVWCGMWFNLELKTAH